jgi:hypothetical protein
LGWKTNFKKLLSGNFYEGANIYEFSNFIDKQKTNFKKLLSADFRKNTDVWEISIFSVE